MITVNADDFGMSADINSAIVECFQRQLIDTTTLMANMPAFAEACDLAVQHSLLDRVGVHLNLTEGRPLRKQTAVCRELCQADGTFRRHRSFRLSRFARQIVADELRAQIDRCRDAGLPITHADSHQHVHIEPALLGVFCDVVRASGICSLRCARQLHSRRMFSPTRWYKSFANGYFRLRGLRRTSRLMSLPDALAVAQAGLALESCEVLVHPILIDEHSSLIDHVENNNLRPLLQELRKMRLPSQ